MNAGLSMSDIVEGGATAGALLREARQAAGVHIAALAVALKVPVSKLEALENDNYAALPDTVFVRALASSVCRTLKIDATAILSLLPQSQSPRLSTDSAGLNAPVKGTGSKSSASLAPYPVASRSRSVTFIVLALLLGALIVFFLPREQGLSSLLSALRTGPSSGDAGTVAEPAVAVPPAVLAPEPTGASTAGAGVGKDPVASMESAAKAAPVSEAASAGTADTGGAPTVASSTLVLRARNQSWVQVKDAAGAVVLQRNLAADESVSVDAPAPLFVVVGRADATEVFVRGQPFSLTGVSRENVARFEVK